MAEEENTRSPEFKQFMQTHVDTVIPKTAPPIRKKFAIPQELHNEIRTLCKNAYGKGYGDRSKEVNKIMEYMIELVNNDLVTDEEFRSIIGELLNRHFTKK